MVIFLVLMEIIFNSFHPKPTRMLKPPDPLFTNLPPKQTGIHFENKLKESKEFSFLTYEYFYNGAGVGIGDVNNDSRPDIYFCGNQVADQLYINQGGLSFTDATTRSGIKDLGGWSSGVSMIDLNQDGWLDIYVCKTLYDAPAHLRANKLYMNQGGGTFKEMAAELGLDDTARNAASVIS